MSRLRRRPANVLCAIVLSLAALPVSAGTISGFPYVGIGPSGPSLVWEISNLATRSQSALQTIGNAQASFGACQFAGANGQSKPVGVGVTWDVRLSPLGAASGWISCRMDFDYAIVSVDASDLRYGIANGYQIDTAVRFDPSVEIAYYGWSVFAELQDANGGLLHRIGEPNRLLACNGGPSPPNFGNSCNNFYDYNVAPPWRLAAGDRGSGFLLVDLFFDVRSVDAPAGTGLFGLAFGAMVMALRRRRGECATAGALPTVNAASINRATMERHRNHGTAIMRSARAALVCLLGLLAFPAHASVVTLDFEEFSGTYYQNQTSRGFRISPSCHFDAVPQRIPGATVAIGGDPAGCVFPNGGNPDYLGKAVTPPSFGNYVYFDYGGQPFTFLSFDWFGFGVFIFSSNGGQYSATEPLLWNLRHVTLAGPEWEGLSWIVASLTGPGDPGMFLDNMAFQVVTPEGLPLFVMALALLLAVRSWRTPAARAVGGAAILRR